MSLAEKYGIKRTIRIHTVVRFSVGRVTACKNRLSAPSKLSKIGYLCNSGIDFVACNRYNFTMNRIELRFIYRHIHDDESIEAAHRHPCH